MRIFIDNLGIIQYHYFVLIIVLKFFLRAINSRLKAEGHQWPLEVHAPGLKCRAANARCCEATASEKFFEFFISLVYGVHYFLIKRIA